MQTYIILCLGIILGAFYNIITYKISGGIFLISLFLFVICKSLPIDQAKIFRIILIFICGFSYSSCRVDYRNSQQLTQNISKIYLYGYINSPIQNKHEFNQTTFKITKGSFKDQEVILHYNPTYTIQAGYNYRIVSNLQTIQSSHNIEGFNNEQFLTSRNIFAIANLKASPQKLTRNYSFGSQVNLIRSSIITYLNKNIGTEKYGGTFIAMVTGYQSYINTTEWDTFRKTGILHLVSVSGLPLELVTISFLLIFNIICKTLPANKVPRQIITVYASILLTIIYAFISGFGIPTQRVLFMVIIAGYFLVNRLYIPLVYKLIISLTLVLVFDPFAVFNLGFWFSYMLVASMFIVISLYKSDNKFKIWFMMQISLALCTIPLSLYYFSSTSVSSPIANLWAVPVIGSLLTPMMFICSILHITPLIEILCTILDYAMKPIEFLGQFPMYWQAKPNLANILIAYLGIIILIIPLPFRGKNMFAIFLISSLIFTVYDERIYSRQAKIILFSNPNTGFAIIHTENHNILVINHNNDDSINKDFDYTVLPYLQSRNIIHIDYLISNQNESDLTQHMQINNIDADIYNDKNFVIDNVAFYLEKQANLLALLVKTKHNINYLGNCLKTQNNSHIKNMLILMPNQSCTWLLSGKYDNLIINHSYEQQRQIDSIFSNLHLEAKNTQSLYKNSSFEFFSD